MTFGKYQSKKDKDIEQNVLHETLPVAVHYVIESYLCPHSHLEATVTHITVAV